MANYLRYALATFCFAASVGCLGLWWRSVEIEDTVFGPSFRQGERFVFASKKGSVQIASLVIMPVRLQSKKQDWRTFSQPIQTAGNTEDHSLAPRQGFRLSPRGFSFPLWYPALVFALAGVGVVRFRRQFSIRSALVATTVIASLVGMAVIL